MGRGRLRWGGGGASSDGENGAGVIEGLRIIDDGQF